MLTKAASIADDLFAPVEPIPTAATDGFVLCELAGISLAIPQPDVVTIEHGGELAAPLPGEPAIGWFSSAAGPWPVYALDSELQLLPPARATGAFLVFVKSQPWPAGLLCNSVRLVRARSELDARAVPAIMQSAAVCGVARIDSTHVALVFGAGALAAHLAQIAADGAQHE